MNTDQIFRNESGISTDFAFTKKVAEVFDDMVLRSIPYYIEIQRMISELSLEYALPETTVYDLGCSTGTTMIALNKVLPENVRFVGIDNSSEMLKVCASNINNEGFTRPCDLINADLNKPITLKQANMAILCLTLQFVRPMNRLQLLTRIHEQLNPGGSLIVVEKILSEDPVFNRSMIRYYYDFKRRNQYNEIEIAQKREALENVLIPFSLEENHRLLRDAGFQTVDTFFKWYNFTGLIAVK